MVTRDRGREVGLASFYDLVSTAAYPELSERFSMRFGGEYRFEKLARENLERFAADLGVRAKFVADAMADLIESAAAVRTGVASVPELAEKQGLVGNILSIWDARARTLSSL